ncbi:MAG: hypothetical protein JXB30_15040 [Anaerolineae bacterium]|nr:hypothetical protein [Anaerolineae bacterium]
MAKLTPKQLEKHLKARSHDDLVIDILELFKRIDAVKDFYQLRLSGGPDEDVLERYKAQIKKEFFPARGYGQARLSIAKKPVSEYGKVAYSAQGQVDLMLYYVEMGVKYTNAYGDINEAFYSSMESMFDRACKLITKEGLVKTFADRCVQIVRDTGNIGWGFHDTLSEIYDEYIEQGEGDA